MTQADLLQQILTAIDAESHAIDRVSIAAKTFIRLWWAKLDPTDPGQVKDFLVKVSALDTQVRKQIAGIADAYMRSVLTVLDAPSTGKPVPIADLPRGIPLDVQWRRPVDEVIALRASGLDEAVASDRGLRRTETMFDMDLRLAQRDGEANRMATSPTTIGWRRIVHPERATIPGRPPPPVCGLCLVAADRLYKREVLKEMHDNCRCTTLPVTETSDPGVHLNNRTLDEIYRMAGSTNMKKLARVRIATHQHGELGPVLTNADHHFRGPREVGKDAPDLRALARLELTLAEAQLDALVRQEAAGEDVSGPLAWQRDRIEALRALAQA